MLHLFFPAALWRATAKAIEEALEPEAAPEGDGLISEQPATKPSGT